MLLCAVLVLLSLVSRVSSVESVEIQRKQVDSSISEEFDITAHPSDPEPDSKSSLRGARRRLPGSGFNFDGNWSAEELGITSGLLTLLIVIFVLYCCCGCSLMDILLLFCCWHLCCDGVEI